MTRGQDVDAEFTAFVTSNWTRLVRSAHLITGDWHRAHDLVQVAMERCYPRWRSIRGDPYSYVRRAVVNAHHDWWRRGGHRELAVPEVLDGGVAPDPAVDQARRDAVLRALAGLTRRERCVVVLRFYEDLSEPQTADVLGIAVGTVKSTASRALAKLRAPASGEALLALHSLREATHDLD